ncbi:putative sulfate exporter family transporter, partial [Staphylococcus cohnii]|uniref:putative sulfate exporter family transporter n=1 Tax=Staphylococcus cohnii TaxID=29382 RepID=UPI0011A3D790
MITFKSQRHTQKKPIHLPYFLLPFLIIPLFHTYLPFPHILIQIIHNLTTISLFIPILPLPLNLSFKHLKHHAFNPLILVLPLLIFL